MEKFIRQIQNFVPEAQIKPSDLEPFCVPISLRKDDVLLSLGNVCKHYYFVNEGVLRIFYLFEGKEFTNWVAFENYFFTELESYTSGKSSQYEIVATEKTEVLKIHKDKVDFLFEHYDWWRKFLFVNHQETVLNLIKVIQSFQAQSATDRYEELFRYPAFLQKIKQKDLATMLGITRYSLSRLRGKK